MALLDESVCKSRMTGDCHVRFCERFGVKVPLSTRRAPGANIDLQEHSAQGVNV